MKRAACIVLVIVWHASCALSQCNQVVLSQHVARVLALNAELRQIKVEEMVPTIPTATAEEIARLKNALSRASDAALSCEQSSVAPSDIEARLAQLLHANAPESPSKTAGPQDQDISDGVYGEDLKIEVRRPKEMSGVLTVQYSISNQCGDDNMLLVYELRDGRWKQELRWQSPLRKETSDAFGDFFVFKFLTGEPVSNGEFAKWHLAVAHGRPWCTSRFSGFAIDLLAPGPNPGSPRVVWHTTREYSRGDFEPTLKSSGDAFELRINADCMSFDVKRCFERRVIYRYAVDKEWHVRRTNPLALDARGFVSEWLTAPWSESRVFSAPESTVELKEVYDQFDPMTQNDDRYISHSYGPVLACAAAKTFQVQINSILNWVVLGKPGGEQQPLASRYFQVREAKDGYIVLSAPTEPDPTCAGANLMPDANR